MFNLCKWVGCETLWQARSWAVSTRRTGTAMVTSDRTSLSKCYMEDDIRFSTFKGRGVLSALQRGLGSHVETGADVASSHCCAVVLQRRFSAQSDNNTLGCLNEWIHSHHTHSSLSLLTLQQQMFIRYLIRELSSLFFTWQLNKLQLIFKKITLNLFMNNLTKHSTHSSF